MAGACHDSSQPKRRRLINPWWLLGAFGLLVAAGWLFPASQLLNELAPLLVGGLALVWLVGRLG